MLELKNICKDYYIDKKPFRALKNISVYFPKHEFCSILGPSGCGKTTTLNIIGGLDRYTSGDLVIDGKSTKTFTDADWDNYRNKRIGFVFQSYNLISHLTILDNVVLSLTLGGMDKKERVKRAKEALDAVGLKGLYNKKPNQLSGGQMQRVAIARSLVNDPEIILADEPTGALDSKTSVQIMDILKEISLKKLVIMVTHNDKLAKKYSDRIIIFKDGEIVDDTKDGELDEKLKEEEKFKEENNIGKLLIIDEKDKEKKKEIKNKKKKEKTSMSFFTAFNISFKNIRTKKGRTILTSVAASFGIIGVALVLALSNGFNEYINRVQSETSSTLPITVSSYTVKYQSVDPTQYNQSTKYPSENEIYPYINMNNEKNMTISYNNFNNKYFNYLNKLRDEDKLLNDYLVNYPSNYKYHLTTEYPKSIDESSEGYIGQVSTAQSTGTINSMLGSITGLPSTVFHQLYGREEYILNSYEVIKGTYPKEKNELCLVINNTNSINFSNLRNLGFYNSVDTQEQVQDSETSKKVKPISMDDIIGKKYKVYSSSDFYTMKNYTSSNENVGDMIYFESNSVNDLYNDSSKGIELKITGILRPSKNSTISTMANGLCYLSSLQDYLVEKNAEADLSNNYYNLISMKEGKTKISILSDLIKVFQDLGESSISTSVLNNFNNTITDNFYIFNPYKKNNYIDTKAYLNYAMYEGLDLVPSELKASPLSEKLILTYIKKATEESDEEFIKKLIGLAAYINSYSQIESVVIFPKDLTTKNELLAKLDEYNEIVPNSEDHASNTGEQIYYTDYVGDLTASLGEMINVISIVLIVFASISLVVSCVMTGIITYNSVIERTKEIGVLRAIGARKKDVGVLFEAESFIVGLFSGIIGCFASYLICFPINLILNNVYPDYNLGQMAHLSIYHCLALIAISILLTLVSGLFPARVAAKKDPVIALRSE